MRLLGRLLVIPVGLAFAALAALAMAIAGAAANGLADLAETAGLASLFALLTGTDPSTLAASIVLLATAVLFALVVPIVLVALVAELFGLGSWLVQAFGAGAAYAAIPLLFSAHRPGGSPEGFELGFLATGLVAGTVYWLVAGRGAARPVPTGASAGPHRQG